MVTVKGSSVNPITFFVPLRAQPMPFTDRKYAIYRS